MGIDINWGVLNNRPDYGQSLWSGYARGKRMGALSALGQNPDSQSALAGLMSVDPQAALQIQQNRRDQLAFDQQQADRRRADAARDAQAAYYTERSGGALGSSSAPPASPSLPVAGYGVGVLGASSAPSPAGDDAAWNRWAAIDPAGATKARQQEAEWQSSRMKLTRDQIDAHQAVNSLAVSQLMGVHDQASCDAARKVMAGVYDKYGYEMPEVPATYSPEVVHDLKFQALEMKDEISAEHAEHQEYENGRHNRATEANAGGHLALDRRRESRLAAQPPGSSGGGHAGVPVISRRAANGQTYYQINGQWFDNPEGR